VGAAKGNIYFKKFCFCTLCATKDMFFNKPVTKEVPYSLLCKNQFRKMLSEAQYVQNHWVYEFCLQSKIPSKYKIIFQKLGLFPSSGERRETSVVLALALASF
jgi:hypothetical protein